MPITNRIMASLSDEDMKQTIRNVFNMLKVGDTEKFPGRFNFFISNLDGARECLSYFPIVAPNYSPRSALNLLKGFGFEAKGQRAAKKTMGDSTVEVRIEKTMRGVAVGITVRTFRYRTIPSRGGSGRAMDDFKKQTDSWR